MCNNCKSSGHTLILAETADVTLHVLRTPAYREWGERAPAIDRAAEVLTGHDGNSDVQDEMRA